MKNAVTKKPEKKRMGKTEEKWRGLIADRCGGVNFDKPGGGYAFSEILRKERELQELNILGDPTSALLTLSIADPTWKMHRGAMRAANLYYRHSPDATRYTDNYGVRICPEAGITKPTHELLADYLNTRFGGKGNAVITADQIQYSPGAIKRALSTYVPAALFDEKSILIFPTPGYQVIKNKVNCRRAMVVDVPMIYADGKWDFDLSPLPAGWQRKHKIFMYVNIPENPTAVGYDRLRWKKLLAWARKNNVILIVDEAYIDICYNPDCVSVLTIPEWERKCIILQSVSKGWSATGLRFGWMVGHPTIVKALSSKVTDTNDSGMFGPSIAAGLYLLRHPEYTEKTRGKYLNLHRLLFEGLSSLGFQTSMPDAGLCQLTPAPRAADGYQFKDVFECEDWFRESKRISLMPYMVGNDSYLRWAVTLKPVPECGLPDEKSVIKEAIRRLRGVQFEF